MVGGPPGQGPAFGKRAGEIRSFLRRPPKSLLLWPLCLPPGPPPASRRECPLLSSAERALPELHFWDSSTLLSLALCQLPPTLPDSPWLSEAGPQPVPSRHPVPWWRRQEATGPVLRAAPCRLPHPLATPTPSTRVLCEGQTDVPGHLPQGKGCLAPRPPPRWLGQPHGYF